MQGTMVGDNLSEAKVVSYTASAAALQETSPNLAALYFAKIASAQQNSGWDYSEALANAKDCLEKSEKQGIKKTTPADFLPSAYILGIAKRATQGIVLPSPAIVASIIGDEPSLLKDYALVLPEEDRKSFLGALPENKRASISLQLDRSVSTVLEGALIEEETDIAQREAVKLRVEEAFSQSLIALKGPFPEGADVDGRALGSRWSSKQLTETIVNLGEEDCLRLLRDLSEQTTRNLKALNKDYRKMSTEERRYALRPAISFTARVLDTLIDVDTRRSGVLAMRYLEMTALPERLFNYFVNKLINKEYFTKNLHPFLKDGSNIPVLKKIMARYGSQFNTIINTISQTPDYLSNQGLATNEIELFAALEDLGTLTPLIFARYRSLPQTERKSFAERIRVLKPQFFRNVPIKNILNREDRDILAEMVYMSYKPMGMSFDQVEQLIGRVDDHTDDLSSYNFPQEGYLLTLERQGKYIVKEQQQIDIRKLGQYRDIFTPIEMRDAETESLPLARAIHMLAQPQPQVEAPHQQERNPNMALQAILSPLQTRDRVQAFLNRYQNVSMDNSYQMISELIELTGVYFRDNYTGALAEYFRAKPAEFQAVVALLTDNNFRKTIDDRLKQSNIEINWQELDLAQPGGLLSRFFPRQPSFSGENQLVVARTLSEIIEHIQIGPIQKQLKDEQSKFVLSTNETSSYRGALKAYVSKNVASFFAKAAAGICTSQDIPLFERRDHFHINVVENDETVRANIQAYVQRVNGQQALILRGFNPTADWVGKIDIEGFCEQILAVGKQFQQENGLAAVYITQQGGWHALSNRDQVARYLIGQYIEGKKGTPFDLQVASSQSIQTIYEV